MDTGAYILKLHYNPDDVLSLAECSKEDKNYEQYKARLEELASDHLRNIQAKGYALETEYLGEKVLFCMATLGDYLDGVVAKAFETYEYLDGMILNALGDVLLFEATGDLYHQLKTHAAAEHLFLSNRIEPGTTGAHMSLQKVIYDKVVPAYGLDLKITEGMMLSPAKTLAYYYKVTEEDCSQGIDHDCSVCDSLKCRQRQFLIRIHKENTTEVLQAKRGENLLEVLRRHNVFLDAPCGGKGTCGKCKIEAKNHGYDLSERELRFLSDSEAGQDVLLACYHTIDRNLDLYPITESGDHEIETGYSPFEVKSAKYDEEAYVKAHFPYGIGVDIGTTTLAVSLINLVTREVLGIKKKLNPQKAYGADVISRIMHAQENPDHTMGSSIRETIESLSKELILDNGYNPEHLEAMVISGNTTMIYLLLGIDPAPLAVAPFTTVDMGIKVMDSEALFSDWCSFEVTILPFISAYVGGDIVSGLYATHMKDKNENIIFVDIGTNGEMVLNAGGRMICASTAAGPAFEGANIKCGMGSVAGAICEIHQDDDGYDVETLGDAKPIGICGSALIDAVALLHRQGFVDDMGFMAEPVMFHENIGIYPEDIRQVQLAKAAIMAGIIVLLEEGGLTYEDVDALYIAGGFGSHIDIDNSAYIGLIPKEVADRVVVVGNTSLAGSVRYLLEKDGDGEIMDIRENCTYLELSTSMRFNEAYVSEMTFGDLKW